MAILNQQLRLIFLQAMRLWTLEYYEPPFWEEDYENQLLWLIRRNIEIQMIDYQNFHPLILRVISQSRRKLRSLSMRSCESITNDTLEHIGSCPKLNDLQLINCDETSHLHLHVFFSNNQQLRKLVFFSRVSLSPNYISCISNNCLNLVNLDLSHNNWFNDDCVTLLTTMKGNMPLQILNISSTHVRSDLSIRMILDSFPNLCSISLYECLISADIVKVCLRRVIYPSLVNEVEDVKIYALSCLHENVIQVKYFLYFL